MRLSDSEVVPFQQKMPYFSSNGIEIEAYKNEPFLHISADFCRNGLQHVPCLTIFDNYTQSNRTFKAELFERIRTCSDFDLTIIKTVNYCK